MTKRRPPGPSRDSTKAREPGDPCCQSDCTSGVTAPSDRNWLIHAVDAGAKAPGADRIARTPASPPRREIWPFERFNLVEPSRQAPIDRDRSTRAVTSASRYNAHNHRYVTSVPCPASPARSWSGATSWRAERSTRTTEFVALVDHTWADAHDGTCDPGEELTSESPWRWHVLGPDGSSVCGRAETPVLAAFAAETVLIEAGVEIAERTKLRRVIPEWVYAPNPRMELRAPTPASAHTGSYSGDLSRLPGEFGRRLRSGSGKLSRARDNLSTRARRPATRL